MSEVSFDTEDQLSMCRLRVAKLQDHIKELEAQLEQARGLPRFNVEPPYPSGGNLRIIAAKDGQWVRADELAAITGER
jgi:hypothetical protein